MYYFNKIIQRIYIIIYHDDFLLKFLLVFLKDMHFNNDFLLIQTKDLYY